MPYTIKKTDGYSVYSPDRTHARGTSKAKAEAQVRLLKMVEHGGTPRKRKRKGKGHEMPKKDSRGFY